MLIDVIFSKLSPSEQAALMTAFEQGIACFVNYRDDRFIGIYTDNIKALVCENKSGNWCEGYILEKP